MGDVVSLFGGHIPPAMEKSADQSDIDDVLDSAKTLGYESIVIIGMWPGGECGTTWYTGEANPLERALWLLEQGKEQILFEGE